MARAKRLKKQRLKAVRRTVLEKGGVLFERKCPRHPCHSSVVLHGDSVVCLTCGWHRPASQWGDGHVHFSPRDAEQGSRAGFRALALLADPRRWVRLARGALRRGDEDLSELYLELTRGLPTEPSPPARTPPRVAIYTDGGCKPNPGPGGWAALLRTNGLEMELAGGEVRSTNNRMELMAALQGLRSLKRRCRVTVVSDSSYLVNGMTRWIAAWSRNGWRRTGELIPNADLWIALILAAARHEVRWTWIRGHSGHRENDRCDSLAASMRDHPDLAAEGVLHRRRRRRACRVPRLPGAPTAEALLDSPPPPAREAAS